MSIIQLQQTNIIDSKLQKENPARLHSFVHEQPFAHFVVADRDFERFGDFLLRRLLKSHQQAVKGTALAGLALTSASAFSAAPTVPTAFESLPLALAEEAAALLPPLLLAEELVGGLANVDPSSLNANCHQIAQQGVSLCRLAAVENAATPALLEQNRSSKRSLIHRAIHVIVVLGHRLAGLRL